MNETLTHATIQPEDLFRLRYLNGARFSPNGKSAVYTVLHADIEQDKEFSTLWLVDLATGQSRQLTAGLTRDGAPCWSPDGRQIAFISNRGGRPQIYLIPVDGGEARPLTSLEQGVGGAPAWSPDGSFIAFTAGPQKPALDPRKPYRITRPVYRVDGGSLIENLLQDIYIIPASGGEARRLTSNRCSNAGPAWSPDSQEIAFTSSMGPDTFQASTPQLWIVNLRGEIRELAPGWGEFHLPTWTPDGQQIVFGGRPQGALIGSQYKLFTIAAQGGEPECRTAGLGFQLGGSLQPDMPAIGVMRDPRVLISRDGKSAYVQVQAGGTVPVYRIALQGPEDCQVVIGGQRSCIPLDLAEGKLLFLSSTLNNPTDLHLAAWDGSGEQQLTHLNDEFLSRRALPTVEHLLFPGSDGVPVEGWLLKPPAGEAPYPTILYIHGGPHSAFGHAFSFDFQMLAGAGYAVLFINQRGSTGYGDDFANGIIGDWGNLDYRDLMAGVDAAIARGWANPDRLGCCGISGGGNLSCWIVGNTDRFKAAVPENPLTNHLSFMGVSDSGYWSTVREMGGLPHEIPEVYRRCSPLTYAHRCKTPTLLIQGELDVRCPPEQSEQFYVALKAAGCTVEMLRLPNSPHAGSIVGPFEIRRAQNDALLDWMNRYVRDSISTGK